MISFSRSILLVFAGLFGAAGIGGAAIAAHGGEAAAAQAGDGRLVAIAAAIALVHATALLGLAAMPAAAIRLRTPAGLAMVAGTLLFSGDLAARSFLDGRLFANAAPAGGMILIAAWLLVSIGAIAAAMLGRDPNKDPMSGRHPEDRTS